MSHDTSKYIGELYCRSYSRADKQRHADVPEEVRLKNGITPCTLRLSVGIEDVEDLLAELSDVFGQLNRPEDVVA